MPVFAVLVASVLPAAADETGPGAPHATGVQNAITRIQEATARHIQILTDLLAKVPPQAQSGIQRAIEAAQQGHDKAIAALEKHAAAGGGDEQETREADSDAVTQGAGQNGKPETTGLARARLAVAAGFDKSAAVLQKVIGEAPDQAKAALQAALANVQQNRTVALQNLDRPTGRIDRTDPTDRNAPSLRNARSGRKSPTTRTRRPTDSRTAR
ncbi:MAG: hypothetical protein AUI47_01670 [Acidobacteria bacterium 13_1_40CM_2_68_5]|nr:MAG: hypothetical protein AUI47_01670 [Acidobacteria bacterium 13_1_40CM_2_68_5]